MNRLKELRIKHNELQEELGKIIGKSGRAIGNYETGKRKMSPDIVLTLAEHFKVSTDYLLGKSDNWYAQNSSAILVYGTIPAGIPMEMIEDIIDTEEIDSNMLKSGKEFFGLKVKGNSMYPDYLDGDIIILEKVDDCESGQDCVVMVNGNDGTFKKVIKDKEKKTIRLQPINTILGSDGKPLYEPITFTEEEIEKLPVKVIGKVVELRRKK